MKLLFLAAFAAASEVISLPDHFLQKRQATTGLGECRLNFTTSPWEGCQDVLDQFGLNLASFVSANPGLSSNCGNFVPGSTYCIYRPGM